MTATVLASLVFGWLVATAPPAPFARLATYPEAEETADERELRYADIAEDVAAVVATDVPELAARRRAAALLVAIAWHESGFAKDVDLGPCAPGRLKGGGCDSGRAVSLWQVQNHSAQIAGRRDAARIALRLARRSFQACRHLPRELRLAVYAGGTCGNRKAQQRSAEIVAVFDRVLGLTPDSGDAR